DPKVPDAALLEILDRGGDDGVAFPDEAIDGLGHLRPLVLPGRLFEGLDQIEDQLVARLHRLGVRLARDARLGYTRWRSRRAPLEIDGRYRFDGLNPARAIDFLGEPTGLVDEGVAPRHPAPRRPGGRRGLGLVAILSERK